MLRISTQKLNLVAATIRGKRAATAVADLQFLRKRIAVDVKKCVESAIANAENNQDLDIDALIVAEAFVSQGPSMKRFRPAGRGRSGSVIKELSSLTVILRDPNQERRKEATPEAGPRQYLAAKMATLANSLRDRSTRDDAVVSISSLRDELSASTHYGRKKYKLALRNIADTVAQSVVPLIVCGSDAERAAAFSCLAAALSITGESDPAGYIAAQRVPCVTEVVCDADNRKGKKGHPIKFSIALTRMIRTGVRYPDDVKSASLLAKLPLWDAALDFKVRVSAPTAKIEPPTDSKLQLSPKDARASRGFVVTPTKAGHLPIVVDFLIGGGRFARQALAFEIS
jgi:large subunit ribosomal protein L22